jgi:hypothetical protein
MNFEQKLDYLKSIGFISTGFGGVWINRYNSNQEVEIIFKDDLIIIKQSNKSYLPK